MAGLDGLPEDLGSIVISGYTVDDQSRESYMHVLKEVAKTMEVDLSSKSYPFENSANVNVPLVQSACMTFAARAYPAMIKDGNVIKAKPIGDDSGKYMTVNPANGQPYGKVDPQTGQFVPEPKEIVPPGAKQARADRVQEYMNWQILYKMHNWEDKFDELLHVLPAYGSVFKKVYYSDADALKHSDLIFPQFLCVNMAADTIETADRVTQLFSLSTHEIMQRINEGVFIDFSDDFLLSDGPENIEVPKEFIEQHTRIDLDGDGYPEPYVIVVYKETERVVGVYKRFDEVFYKNNDPDEGISYIEARNYYVHFKFIPDFTGGFYGIGFGHLMLKLNATVNSLVNQVVDTGHMSLMGGGFIGKGLRMRGGKMRIPLGSYHVVNSTGRELKDNIVPLNVPPPSGTVLTLYDYLLNYTKNLGGMRDVLEGQLRSDQNATATIAMIDQALGEFKSIFKRIYRSMKKEFEMLYVLDAEHPNYGEYQRVLDIDEIDIEDDINLGTYDVYPVADMSELTSIQRQMKTEVTLQMAQAGMVAMAPAVEDRLKALGIPDYERYLDHEPTDQEKALQQQLAANHARELEIDMMKQVNEQAKIEISAKDTAAEVLNKVADAVDKVSRAEDRQVGRQFDMYSQNLKQLAEIVNEADSNQGRLPGMEGQPSNPEVLQPFDEFTGGM